MAQIHENDPYHAYQCDICGEPATAFWMGNPTVMSVCQACGTHKLPLLIADSIETVSYESAERTLKQIISSYWRGLALRAIRERDDTQKELIEKNRELAYAPAADEEAF